jgi:NTE family protein
MTRVGLVLGAGGTVGQAYHAGVLAALEHDLGWDPRTADVIVGTSAGSVTGSLLRTGVPAHDLAAWSVKAPLSKESRDVREWLTKARPTFPEMTLDFWRQGWRKPPAALLRRIVQKPWALRPLVIAASMMPVGEVDLLSHVTKLDDASPDGWPEGLWICATQRDDGRTVVFGQEGAPRAALSEAVAASCAIPGYFSPIALDGEEYVDGGVRSPSNADMLVEEDVDLVIVVSPMSAAGGLGPTWDTGIRYAVHRRLEREIIALREAGKTVVRIEPSRDALEAMGMNMMAQDRADGVVQAAFCETGRYTAQRRIARRLEPLDVRGRMLSRSA